MRKYLMPSGAIEYRDTEEEKESKDKFKDKKKASDLTDTDVREIVFKLAKQAHLL